ncbi:head-tail connector protein [Nitrobacter sp.]|uniref:head-tail connector protein n=1 Tax=Nitrobacter sp. TaxID=29420 RepID=UPI0029CAAD67|nr:head-tail connector protein [Nitrobacter sp.]
MPSILLSGPAVEPWSVAEAKSFLRAENDDDDTVIASLIAAARSHVEAMTRCALIAQTWRFVLDRWPKDGCIRLGRGPLRTLVAARIYDSAGNASVIDAGTFVLDKTAGVIAPSGWSLPAPGRATAGIELDVEIGFGTGAADVPDALRHAVRTLVAHWHENRGLIAIGQSVAMMPASVSAMIASYRVQVL